MTLSSTQTPHKGNTGTLLLAGLIVSAASFYTPMINAAPIYKVVDENTGQVTFTDRPQNYEQQADKQISQTSVTTGNSSDSSTTSRSGDTGLNSNANNEPNNNAQTTSVPVTPVKAVQVNYQLTIIEPSEERAYRRPAQNIIVNARLKPALQIGDSASIYLDGNEVAQGLSASIATVDILPGEHSVQAVVKNK